MFRGTTPTFIFKIPFECSSITLCNITFSQHGNVIVNKVMEDCRIDTENNTISVTLTEADTLLFVCDDNDTSTCSANHNHAEVQLRIGCDGTRLASKIISIPVSRILKDGLLSNTDTENEGD